MGGQLPERPSRTGWNRPFQVTVDDPGELGRAPAQLGIEAVVAGRMHRRPPHGANRTVQQSPGNAPYSESATAPAPTHSHVADRALVTVVLGRARCLTFPRKRFV